MSRAADTAAYVARRVAEALGGRAAAGIIHMPLSAGVSGFVGLNRSTSGSAPGWIKVLPVVGVTHDETEAVVADLTDIRMSGQATWSHPLPALVNGLPFGWAFEPPINETHVQNLCDALLDHALPVLRNSTTLSAIRDHLEQGHGPRALFVLPVVLALNGDPDGAVAALDRFAANFRPGPPLDEYLRFGERFDDWLRSRRLNRAGT